jgi:YD repeat-containing protein
MYDADSRRTTLQMGLGTVRQYGLDPLGRITTQIEFVGSNPNTTFIDTYDPVGNRTGRTQDGIVYTWTYDDNYRLTGQVSTLAYATFSYDPMSNTLLKWQQAAGATTAAPQTMSYDPANRLEISTTGNLITTFAYGNVMISTEQTGTSTTSYSYDGETRLVGVDYSSGAPSTYTYQGYDGLRRSAIEPGGSLTTMVWDGSDYLQTRT